MKSLGLAIALLLLAPTTRADVWADSKFKISRDSNDKICGAVAKVLTIHPGRGELGRAKFYLITAPNFKFTQFNNTRELYVESPEHVWFDIYTADNVSRDFFNQVMNQIQSSVITTVSKSNSTSIGDAKFCMTFERGTTKVLYTESLAMSQDPTAWSSSRAEEPAMAPTVPAALAPAAAGPAAGVPAAAAQAPAAPAKALAAPAAVPPLPGPKPAST
ncbi:MAG: hypothetical protein ABL958_18345, partial [Bdellovibrionia bacterium]